MKKIVLLTMCLLAFYNAKAQYIGLKAGYNYANLKGEMSSDASIRPYHGYYNVGRGINLHVGPQLEYRIDKPNFYFDGTDPVTRVKPDALDMVDLGMTAGIGYTTDSGWVFELRYLQGLTSIFEGDQSLYNTHFSTDYDFKNRTISVGVGYIF